VDLHSFFTELSETYDLHSDFKSAGQALLKSAPDALRATAPPTITIATGGGKGVVTATPWVAYMNPDETASARHGIYVVYLLSADKEKLVLILGQGVSELSEKYGATEARNRLAAEALRLRNELASDGVTNFNDPVDLRSKGALQRSYIAGSICCRAYSSAELPDAVQMQRDLDVLLDLCQSAIEAKQRLLLTEPGVIETSSSTKTNQAVNPLIGFKPKNSDDYRSTLVGRVLVKSRRHELLVKNFGEACQAKGFEPFTPHPIDLVLRLLSKIILVEAKVVYKGDATSAVRGAIGQLFDYQYHLYPAPEAPHLVALFSESIGDDYVQFLENLRIGAVWWTHEGWQSSSLTEEWGITSLN
jgi:hypothetical protein